ncbi:MAG: ATP-grasp domain-containing protein [Cellulosilyticum sp.]|nr:ATP-grasp domain-containing protein [Cellulosilyticum sp.]
MNLSDVKQIGIVGGGPSTLMLCFEFAKLGIQTCILDPEVNCMGSAVASEHIIASINKENIKKLSLRCDKVIVNKKLDFEMDVKLHAPIYPTKEVLDEVCSLKNILDITELLEIPTTKVYYQNNKEEAFEQIDGLTLPFRFIKQYKGYSKQLDVFSPDDLADFILEVDEEAESFILQPIEAYKQTISCICFADTQGKVHLYHPIEVVYEEDGTCHLAISDRITKTMVNRLNRYNRKLMKEINAVGAFTIRYGVKANKSVEFIDMTPELGVGSLLTLEAFDVPVFEQYARMVLEMKINAPELLSYAHGTIRETGEVEKNEVGKIYKIEQHKMCIRSEKMSE